MTGPIHREEPTGSLNSERMNWRPHRPPCPWSRAAAAKAHAAHPFWNVRRPSGPEARDGENTAPDSDRARGARPTREPVTGEEVRNPLRRAITKDGAQQSPGESDMGREREPGPPFVMADAQADALGLWT